MFKFKAIYVLLSSGLATVHKIWNSVLIAMQSKHVRVFIMISSLTT